MMIKVGTVKEIWRYPVKSMGGEILEQGFIDKKGIVGDRYWAIRDETANELTNVRKTPELLRCNASYQSDPSSEQRGDKVSHVAIKLPNDQTLGSDASEKDAILSEFLKKPVSLWPLQAKSNWQFYLLKTLNTESSLKKQFNTKQSLPNMASISWSKLLELSLFATPLGRYYDMYPLHILTSNSLAKLQSLDPDSDFQVKRFRPNLYIQSEQVAEKLEEFAWVGGLLYIGETVIRCESRTVRCSMPAQPQQGVEKDVKVLRTLEQQTKRHLGINASVIKQGPINVGDVVIWEPESKYSLRRLIRPISAVIRNAVIQATLKLGNIISKK